MTQAAPQTSVPALDPATIVRRASLTHAESSVFRCVGKGLANKTIAARLLCTESSVEAAIVRIRQKITRVTGQDAYTRVELAMIAAALPTT